MSKWNWFWAALGIGRAVADVAVKNPDNKRIKDEVEEVLDAILPQQTPPPNSPTKEEQK